MCAGESRQVQLSVRTSALWLVNNLGNREIIPGQYALHVGGRAPGQAGLVNYDCHKFKTSYFVLKD